MGRSFRSAAAAALVASVCLVPLRAHAGTDTAWSAAKANLPKDTMVLVGLDLAQLTQSTLFSFAFPMMLSQQPDVKAGLELVKSSCQLDPMKTIKSVVVGTDDAQKHGAIYVAVDGLDQAKLVSCLEAVGKAQGKDAKVSVKTEGKVTEVAIGDKTIFLSWIGANVLVLPLEFSSKADLQAWSGTKGLAKSKVAKAMAKANTGAALWAVSAVPKELDAGTKMKLGYGSMTLVKGTIAADLHVQVGSAAEAKAAADKAQKELTSLAAQPSLAANIKAVLAGVTVTAVLDEVAIKGSLAESDVLSLVTALMP